MLPKLLYGAVRFAAVALCVGVLSARGAAAANRSATDADKTLNVTVDVPKEAVQVGQNFKVDFKVTNVSNAVQTFRVMNCSWDQHWKSSNKHVGIAGWDCSKNFAVDESLKPGEAYEPKSNMIVSDAKPGEKISFKMGFTPIGTKTTYWSDEVSVEVADPAKQSNADRPENTLAVNVELPKEAIRAGSSFKADLRVTNVSKVAQSFRVMNCSWEQHWESNNKRVSIAPWACTRNFAVEETLQPGDVYARKCDIVITGAKPGEKVAFKMGFTPIDCKTTYWSDEVSVDVAK